MSATENLEKHGVPTSEICRDIAYRQYVGSSFHVVRPLPPYHCRRCRGSGDSGPRETSRWRKLFARCVLGFFIEGYLFPHPSSSIRMAEIKRQINVSRADGPNVRTENPILACRTVRLVRVSSLLSITLSPPSASLSPTLRALSFDPSTSYPILSLSAGTSFLLLLFSHSLSLSLLLLLLFLLLFLVIHLLSFTYSLSLSPSLFLHLSLLYLRVRIRTSIEIGP